MDVKYRRGFVIQTVASCLTLLSRVKIFQGHANSTYCQPSVTARIASINIPQTTTKWELQAKPPASWIPPSSFP